MLWDNPPSEESRKEIKLSKRNQALDHSSVRLSHPSLWNWSQRQEALEETTITKGTPLHNDLGQYLV